MTVSATRTAERSTLPTRTHDSSNATIVVTELVKRYGQLDVLKGISLTARRSDVLAVIGGSGSGKSTLLRCINLLETPTGGTIEIQGERIEMVERRGRTRPASARQVQRLRRRLGMVFQSFNLWQHMTILENVIAAPIHVLREPRAEAIARAEHLLARVGIHDKRHSYPAYLSGGQQQRAAIARALAIRPDALLFDEPTSALDPELVGEVLAVIADLAAEGCTMILVTHEMTFAREIASHVVFLHEGRIEEQGSPKDVFTAPRSERLRRFVSSTR